METHPKNPISNLTNHVGFWVVLELNGTKGNITCKDIHKKFHQKSYHNDIRYHVTLNTMFGVDS